MQVAVARKPPERTEIYLCPTLHSNTQHLTLAPCPISLRPALPCPCSCSYNLTRTRTTLFLERRPDRPVPLGRLCWLCVVLCCAVLCAVLGLRVSTRVPCHPRRVPVTGPSICDVIVVTLCGRQHIGSCYPPALDQPAKQASHTRQLESPDARRGCLVLSKASQCHAKPHSISPSTTSAPSHTSTRIWRPCPLDSTTLCRCRPRASLLCRLCPGQSLRMFAGNYLGRRRADRSQAPRSPATRTSWMPFRSLRI